MGVARILVAIAIVSANAGAQAQPLTGETLPSGVVITHVRPGSGPTPSASDTVRVHYRGTLTNGTEFDNSYKRNEPVSFALTRVIPCWTQGLQKMRPGGKARLFCPAHTAYGARGIPGTIPPDSVLIFDVELLAIE
jgi:FKBP-type peptidyl-prolyl cis-trans isomerase FkpA